MVLHALFDRRAAETPEVVAAVCEGDSLTYAELDGWAVAVASSLAAAGVTVGTPVGLFVEPSLEMVVGMLAILKAGGHYVALSPGLPANRIRSMCEGAEVATVVTSAVAVNKWAGAEEVDVIDVSAVVAENPAVGAVGRRVVPGDLAYILYTSGSTGVPKGVMVEHRNVIALLEGFEAVAPARQPLVGTSLCPYSFDVSVWEIFSVLCFGGTLHVLRAPVIADPDVLASYLLRHGVTSAYIPPGLLEGVARSLRRSGRPLTLDRVLVGVEPIPQSTLQQLRDLSDDLRIVNGYGPTEATVCATFFPFRSATDPGRRTPIGYPVAGSQVHIVDDRMLPVPNGAVGEIIVGGSGVARGYVNDPVSTSSKFLPDPFSDLPGAGRVYRTGDQARALPDGALEYVGRTDSQVKVRGFRVELGEVEEALGRRPGVRRARALAPQSPDGRRLVGFVEGDASMSGADVRRQLSAELPEYMVPSRIVVVERFPVNPNGKVDREALLLLDQARSEPDGTSVAPATTIEGRIADVWREVLGLDQVAAGDNFFDLGGDSLSAITIANRLGDELGCRVTVTDLFLLPTVADLARSLVGGASSP